MDGLMNNGSTPVKRLGLSRKRRSSCLHNVSPLVCSPGTEIKKQNILPVEICNRSLEVEEDFQSKRENKSELEPSILDTQTKYAEKTKELENLYSIWANGFKNAFSYLIKLLEKKPGEPVNVNQLLMQLRIWEIISDHFKNDSELSCYLNNGEDND